MVRRRAEDIEKVKFFLLDGISRKYTVNEAAEFFGCSKGTVLAAHKADEKAMIDEGHIDYYTALMSDPCDEVYFMISMLRLALNIKNSSTADLLKAKMAYDTAIYEEEHRQ